ncbi:MAG: HDIG domain-containing protein [Planctomycetota bacterium]|nr:HDIG domain-containing protein [Planctomycetota bacterium]MDI6786815.1 HDIG domain-containing protein [Planctomycetota bacterium]
MMTRQEALSLMQSRVSNNNLRKHILAVESVMKHLARELKQDEDKWGLVGLLHDLDYEETKNTPEQHTIITAQFLSDKSVEQEIIDAIKAHADKKERDSLMEEAIYCADPVTGFLVACALIHPDKKLAPIDVEFARNRMKEKRFAAGANREAMQNCAKLGIGLERFLQISLDAMKSISGDLGL